MTTEAKTLTDDEVIKLLSQQKERSNQLERRRIQVNALLEQKQSELAEAKKEAVELFGTDDLVLLGAEFIKRSSDNRNLAISFKEKLDKAELDIANIERLFSSSVAA